MPTTIMTRDVQLVKVNSSEAMDKNGDKVEKIEELIQQIKERILHIEHLIKSLD